MRRSLKPGLVLAGALLGYVPRLEAQTAGEVLPSGGSIAAGQAAISNSAQTLTVDQSSAGLGAEYRLGSFLNANVGFAEPLRNGLSARAGVGRFETRVSLSY